MSADRADGVLSRFPADELDRLIATRRDLHRHPELAFEETRTAGIVAARVRELGVEPRTGVGRTGVAADFPASGPRILLRADMDALPLVEESSADYVSESPGRMHACGHDGHVSIALALAARLSRHRAPGPYRLLFQPAEEGAGGA
ncbi:MAG TPA: M20/M25/M40 family metallo-hydrolase, partial [Thermoanaerobaculia bacterium]|nr:M20/M25/M40 family metallo-hydrolase [Thermoanaerobaculia bacterium]